MTAVGVWGGLPQRLKEDAGMGDIPDETLRAAMATYKRYRRRGDLASLPVDVRAMVNAYNRAHRPTGTGKPRGPREDCGHDRSDDYIDPRGRKQCRTCRLEANARWRANRRERLALPPATPAQRQRLTPQRRHQRGDHSQCDYATCYEARQLRHYGTTAASG